MLRRIYDRNSRRLYSLQADGLLTLAKLTTAVRISDAVTYIKAVTVKTPSK